MQNITDLQEFPVLSVLYRVAYLLTILWLKIPNAKHSTSKCFFIIIQHNAISETLWNFILHANFLLEKLQRNVKIKTLTLWSIYFQCKVCQTYKSGTWVALHSVGLWDVNLYCIYIYIYIYIRQIPDGDCTSL